MAIFPEEFITDIDGESCLLKQVSTFTGDVNTMTIHAPRQRVLDWLNGIDKRLIQQAFPDMSAEEREFMMTGATPEEQELVFGSGE